MAVGHTRGANISRRCCNIKVTLRPRVTQYSLFYFSYSTPLKSSNTILHLRLPHHLKPLNHLGNSTNEIEPWTEKETEKKKTARFSGWDITCMKTLGMIWLIAREWGQRQSQRCQIQARYCQAALFAYDGKIKTTGKPCSDQRRRKK